MPRTPQGAVTLAETRPPSRGRRRFTLLLMLVLLGLSMAGKAPGVGIRPQLQEMVFSEHGRADMRPYDRLIGAALNGNRVLWFACGLCLAVNRLEA